MRKQGGRRTETPFRARNEKPARQNADKAPRKDTHKPGARTDSRAFRRPSPELAGLYGYHAVREALGNPRRESLDLFATAAAAEKLATEIAASGVPLHIVDGEALSARLGAEAVHQGVFLEARPLPALDVSEIESRSGLVLALDQITDPHNVGAILRTAAAFAADAVIVTERNAPEFSGVLAKTASGGLEHVPLVEVVNLARALDRLGDAGYLRVGLDSEGPESLEHTMLSRPVALVLGAEGKGLRRLTREKCDVLARLDMPGAIKSLNVSNACAVALAVTRAKLAE
ncbi:23S rRNA (guanosine(2251)-2'-O)-methyltransferase RlmB [Rhodoblastus sp.]|uniref:23S rRNA (guanosine(2251)-2'-O)-methyltransferase RlmB n=1 Tax=Rhodoblastus sp. TaxID=1962975 RepID=UPI0035B4E413